MGGRDTSLSQPLQQETISRLHDGVHSRLQQHLPVRKSNFTTTHVLAAISFGSLVVASSSHLCWLTRVRSNSKNDLPLSIVVQFALSSGVAAEKRKTRSQRFCYW